MFNVQTLVKTGDRPDRRKVFYSKSVLSVLRVKSVLSHLNHFITFVLLLAASDRNCGDHSLVNKYRSYDLCYYVI